MFERIIVVNDFGSINGGAAKVAIDSANLLSKTGFKVTYFCSVGPVQDEILQDVDEVICLNQHDILNNPSRVNAVIQGIWNHKAYKELCNLLDRHKSEHLLVHLHGWAKALSSSVIAACQRKGIKCVITLHDYFSVCPNGGFFNYQQQSVCLRKPCSLDCIFCNCDSRNYFQKCWRVLRQLVQDKYIRRNKKIALIYLSEFSLEKMKNYLASNEFYYVTNPMNSFNTIVDTKTNSIFLYAGRISPEKGVDVFCDAITKLGVKGVVVGEGVDKSKLEAKYPNISFVGWKSQKDMIPYIQKTRALIFPSKWYEVSPLTIPEFLDCRIPCIVPDNCAAKEKIEPGINGEIFKMGDSNSLIEAIRRSDIVSNNGIPNRDYKSHHIEELIYTYELIEKKM